MKASNYLHAVQMLVFSSWTFAACFSLESKDQIVNAVFSDPETLEPLEPSELLFPNAPNAIVLAVVLPFNLNSFSKLRVPGMPNTVPEVPFVVPKCDRG